MHHIVWLRNDLRLRDNPALSGALEDKAPLSLVYILGSKQGARGGASHWYLYHGLDAFSRVVVSRGGRLLLRKGEPETVLCDMARQHGGGVVFWNCAVDPEGVRQDARVEHSLRDGGVSCRVYATTNYLTPHQTLLNASGEPFKVFTPFWKKASALPNEAPLPEPASLPPPPAGETGVSLDDLRLLPAYDWATGLDSNWRPGEKNAFNALEAFLDEALADYPEGRDIPGIHGTSRLSPHLHFGEITPRAILYAVKEKCNHKNDPVISSSAQAFIRQLYWREFAAYLLFHFPHMINQPMDKKFSHFPWRTDAAQLQAWQKGETGYPLVDAGMRELWTTGWMHNRTRMIVGSFLVKQLLLPWQLGLDWFNDTLVDADPANNTLGWQWVGGCGPDAAPYFRIFNPVLQGKRFDPNGVYVRRWLPELGRLDTKWIHAPWEAPASALHQSGIRLNTEYPAPIIDLRACRQRALDAFAQSKAASH